jgi:hypothetical protein
MKKIIFLCLVVSLTTGSCTQEKKSPIEGAWQLAHEYQKSGDKTVAEFPVNITGSEIKVWTEHNFVFVGRFKQDTAYSDTYGGGTYRLDGDNYEETIQFHSYSGLIGQTMKIMLEIKGDTITQTFTIVANGQVNKNEYYIEKWVRIK